jgi:hypothetical protein
VPEPRGQQRHRGVVAMDLLGREDVLADLRHHRVEQPGYPVAQRRAVEFETFTGIDLALAVQRKVVGVHRHQQMRQRGGSGAAARDRHRRCRGLGGRIARGAGTFWLDVTAFAGAIIGRQMHDLLTRQMIGQRLAPRFGALADRTQRFSGIGLSFGFRDGLLTGFEFLKRVRVAHLRRPAILRYASCWPPNPNIAGSFRAPIDGPCRSAMHYRWVVDS